MEAVSSGIEVSFKNQLFCRLDGLSLEDREQQRIAALENLGLLEAKTVPVFEEATQTAAQYVDSPICILSLVVQDELWLKSAVGLSRLGLMNHLAAVRKFPREDSFCTHVVDSQQNLIIEDVLSKPFFAGSTLAQHYGIRAYLGTPLMTSAEQCIGTLAVMDIVPRQFSSKDAEFLALTARWCLREFERNHLLKTQPLKPLSFNLLPKAIVTNSGCSEPVKLQNAQDAAVPIPVISPNDIKVRLLEHLTNSLRSPLTSVIGMTSVLRRGVYGSLSKKQEEYLEVIYDSGQRLLSLVEEIINLKASNANDLVIQPDSADIEMICQQVVNTLYEITKQQRQKLRLSVEPTSRLWSLDREKIRQALYYLLISVIEASEAGSEIRVHVSRKGTTLNIAVWVSHPWLGEGLPQIELFSRSGIEVLTLGGEVWENKATAVDPGLDQVVLSSAHLLAALTTVEQQSHQYSDKDVRELLSLLLCSRLIEQHWGEVLVQSLPGSGYRYVLKLPELTAQ